MPDIYEFLDAHGIAYQRCDHPAVFTVAEVKRLVPPLDGTHTKNLFLRDKKGRRHVLVVVGSDKLVDIKGLTGVLGFDHLSFGSPERLKKYLGIEPGAVSLLALLNDGAREVGVFVDRELWNADARHRQGGNRTVPPGHRPRLPLGGCAGGDAQRRGVVEFRNRIPIPPSEFRFICMSDLPRRNPPAASAGSSGPPPGIQAA